MGLLRIGWRVKKRRKRRKGGKEMWRKRFKQKAV